MLGLAVDSSFGLTEKRKLQMACDAAAKAGATNGGGVTATSENYKTSILTEVENKFLRICSSLKSNSIDIYVIVQANTSYHTPCCNSTSNAYTVSNSTSSIGAALTAIQTKIAAKV